MGFKDHSKVQTFEEMLEAEETAAESTQAQETAAEPTPDQYEPKCKLCK